MCNRSRHFEVARSKIEVTRPHNAQSHSFHAQQRSRHNPWLAAIAITSQQSAVLCCGIHVWLFTIVVYCDEPRLNIPRPSSPSSSPVSCWPSWPRMHLVVSAWTQPIWQTANSSPLSEVGTDNWQGETPDCILHRPKQSIKRPLSHSDQLTITHYCDYCSSVMLHQACCVSIAVVSTYCTFSVFYFYFTFILRISVVWFK